MRHRACVTILRIGGRAVERRTVNRGVGGSIPPTAVSKLMQFRSPHICLCLSEETLKAGGPFYLVSIPGEVKDPTKGLNVQPIVNSLILERRTPPALAQVWAVWRKTPET